MAGFLTTAQLDRITDLATRGYETLEDWTLTDTITVARQGGTVIGTYDVVSIKVNNTQEIATGGGTPLSTTEMDGTLRLWTSDVGSAIRRGDRFIWNDQACVIATPPQPKRGGVTEYGFTIQGRNAT